MKRSILILVIISIFINFSCTIDDEPEESDVNLILGEWSGLGEDGLHEDGTRPTISFGTCHDNDVYKFYEDGRFYWLDFVQNGINSCTEDTRTSAFGTWERISNGKYILSLTSNTNSEITITPFLIEFPVPNSMYIQFEEKAEDLPEGVLYTYKKFVKINEI
jgi:hypothetical protein